MNKLTEQTAPKGARVLVSSSPNDLCDSHLMQECEILQWSGGGRVKVHYIISNKYRWLNPSDIPYLVEVLYMPDSIQDIMQKLYPTYPKPPIALYGGVQEGTSMGLHIHSVGGQEDY